MLVLSQRLLNCRIMSLQTGMRLGVTTEAIIDPRQLHIVAFYCEGPGIDFKPALLHSADIREFGQMGIIINDSDDLMPPDDLVRLQEILDYKFDLIGKQVIDENGRKLGKVGDYTLDTNSFFITQLHVKRPLLTSLNAMELIVNRTQITEITNERIVVKSGMTKASKTTERAKHVAIDNPFRHAQPEGIKQHD